MKRFWKYVLKGYLWEVGRDECTLPFFSTFIEKCKEAV